MTTVIDYAVMAGYAYRTTRDEINWFPVPQGWTPFFPVPDRTIPSFPTSGGFEAISFTNGTEIVISYAGTDPSDKLGDWAANAGLAAGAGSIQLLEAAQYYLQVKASAPVGTTISITGHSLGGGLASLVAAFFGERAFTFDQAPFLQSARMFTRDSNGEIVLNPSVVQSLRDSLAAGGTPVDILGKLDAYIAANNPLNTTPVVADTLAARSGQIVNFNVEGEFISSWFLVPSSLRIGAQIDIRDNTSGVGAIDLHSQALLAAYLQSNQSAVTSSGGQVQSLSEVTFKLQDLLKMIFDKNLFAHDTDLRTTEENFLERLVKHETGVQGSIDSDAMVTRFTSDLWKLAQDGGMTIKDGGASTNRVNGALIAFAMQKYYEETSASAGYRKELFTDLAAANEGRGGIRFDMADVSAKFATAFAQGERLALSEAKGYDRYFKYYLDNNLDVTEANDRINPCMEGRRMKTLLAISRQITKLGLILMAGLTVNAHAGLFGLGGTSWKEEVLLHDGNKIIVERSVSRGGRHEIGQEPPIKEQRLSFVLPSTNEDVIWEDRFTEDVGGASFLPMQLEIDRAVAYLVANPMGCLSYNKWGRPNPPYVVFKYRGKAWQRIELKDLPLEFKTPNLIFSSPDREAAKRDHIVSAEAIRALYNGYKQPEYKTILRDAVRNAEASCPELIRTRDGWKSVDWFSSQHSYEACLRFCAREGVIDQSCPCANLFNRK